jgi:hypothetical protein
MSPVKHRWAGRRLLAAAGLCLSAVPVACGGGTLTPAEYAVEVEQLVADMVSRFATIDAEWESQAPTRDGALEYWERRLEIRTDYLDSITELRVPEGLTEMHEAALDVFARITAADEALARRVAEMGEVTEHRQWLDTPEGAASLAVLEDVYAFCRSSQAEFDATRDRESLEDTPWVPPEMKEVIKVAFGCPANAATSEHD